MLSTILMLLGISYIAVNLVLFGSALVMMPLKGCWIYLFFGTIILLNEFFIRPWTQQ